ncbi:hypothetical protein NQU47_03815 [Pseudoalteromonas distincta]|uniref:hypothetical protein n=1 Tax=Pseudoalteromonas distincta TaxID=77608 RepID=UPI002341F2FC|nr:hypothetical protein [Pseudoalteromonas distincta]MDC3211683.1 hypothetical protein [Pseudoalteromonas distincta]
MRALILFVTMTLVGCSNSEDKKYDLIIPQSYSPTLEVKSAKKTNGSFKILYLKGNDGNPITKTINRMTTVIGSDNETPKNLKERAKKEIVQIATEEVNGVVIKSTSKINTTVIDVDSGSTNTRYSRQDFTEDAVSQTAGIARIQHVQCETLPTKGSNLTMQCSADVTVPLIKEIDISNN